MKLVDETFATGIPSALATLQVQSGAPTVTYNSDAQAVDLEAWDVAANIWEFSQVDFSRKGEVTLDIEFRGSNNLTDRYDGIGIHMRQADASASGGWRFCRHAFENAWVQQRWRPDWWWNGVDNQRYSANGGFVFENVGDRHLLTARWDTDSTKTNYGIEFWIDDTLVFADTFNNIAFRPGFFFFQVKARLHSVVIHDQPSIPMVALASGRIASDIGQLVLGAPELLVGAPQARLSAPIHGNRYTDPRGQSLGGLGVIRSTLKVSPNSPISRKLRLYDDESGAMCGETWSDAATGVYAFTGVNPSGRYTVVAYDYLHNYRAVVADNLTPSIE